MLNFDPDRFLGIQAGALALSDRLNECIGRCLADGVETVYFMGSGGAGVLMLPAAQLLQQRSELPTYAVSAAEVVGTDIVRLGPGALVVAPSLSGTTEETRLAIEWCRARGAQTVALTGHSGSPVGRAADFEFTNFAADDTSSESFYLQSLLIALALMRERKELDDYDLINAELQKMPALLLDVKRKAEDYAPAIATAIARDPYHIITSAGNAWAEAFYYSMCILEEMQWIRTRPVHSANFFHGPLELIEHNVSVMLLKGEDRGRALVDRVERFARNHTDNVLVIDTRTHPLPGLSENVRRLVSPVVLATILERVSAHLEILTKHPLTTRRYYRKIVY